MQAIRTNCLSELVKLDVARKSYFVELEARIFEISGKPQTTQQSFAYYRKYIQLIYNLKRWKDYLISNFSPSELIFLDSEQLNPNVKKEMDESKVQNEKYKRIQNLQLGPEQEEEEDGSLRCPKCKNAKNISVMPRQIRSADEPMSLFITCNNKVCRHRWRIG